MRAKYEQMLGLTVAHPQALPEKQAYWIEEPIVPTRYLELRMKYKASAEWLETHVNQGFQRWTIQIFRAAQLLAAFLLIGCLALGFSHEANKPTQPEIGAADE